MRSLWGAIEPEQVKTYAERFSCELLMDLHSL